MGLLYPELLLLAVPILALWWWTALRRGDQVVRGAILLVLLLSLAGLYLQRTSHGQDVVVLVDASRSMPEETEDRAIELIQLLEDQRGPGDRVAVVRFAEAAVLERPLSEDARFSGFERNLSADASNLGDALMVATGLIPDGRAGRVLLISDGESDGASVRAAAQRAAARNIPVHTRALRRPAEEDLSIVQIDLPDFVQEGAPFQFSAWVSASEQTTTTYTLERDGQVISRGERTFTAGLSRLLFRDIHDAPGVAVYTLRLDGVDRIVENNTGIGAVSIQGARLVLVLNDDGQPDTLVRALQQGGLSVVVKTPEAADLTPVGLTPYRAIILENVSANRLGRGMPAIEDFVTHSGGGLLMTGGKASFGLGGYHESPLDALLPVSMEMRQEHRKAGMAMSIVLDRSGSMSATVDGGQTKMDLANQGTSAAVRLLSPIDAVSVIAVDSEPHTVIPHTMVDDSNHLAKKVLGIESMGGGIYTRVALKAAADQLAKAEQKNRHIILFADAADAEQQDGVPELLETFRAQEITTSVIALGTASDPDAQFLIDVARRGGGSVYFTTRPEDLPRLFAMDTLVMSKSTFIEEPTAIGAQPGLQGLVAWSGARFPTLPAYNMTYLRPTATQGLVTLDEEGAPVFAFHQRGLGRAASFSGQIGGTFGQPVTQWPDFSRFFVSVVRSIAAPEPPQDWFADTRREGNEAIISVEGSGDAPLTAMLRDGTGEPVAVPLTRVSQTRWEGRHTLSTSGVILGNVQVGEDKQIELPAMALPYSPEFAYTPDPLRGERRMREISSTTGGVFGGNISTILKGQETGVGGRVITRDLALLALLLLIIEITMRRLQLWGIMPARPTLPRMRRTTRTAPRKPTASVPAATATATAAAPATAPAEEGDMASALRAARERADRKLRR